MRLLWTVLFAHSRPLTSALCTAQCFFVACDRSEVTVSQCDDWWPMWPQHPLSLRAKQLPPPSPTWLWYCTQSTRQQSNCYQGARTYVLYLLNVLLSKIYDSIVFLIIAQDKQTNEMSKKLRKFVVFMLFMHHYFQQLFFNVLMSCRVSTRGENKWSDKLCKV